MWTVDFKGWWRSWGKRCEPLTVRDEHSRYVLELRAMEDARTETVRRSFERLFERHGLPQAIRSDNGSPFASVHGLFGLSRLSVWWVALGIDLERGRPGHPQDNGAHERMHLDISRELEAIGESDQEALDLWRRSFNYERPHESLGMKCPGELYRASERKYEGTPEDLEYPQMCSRRVSACGTIRLDGQSIFLSRRFGWLECWPQAHRTGSIRSLVRTSFAWGDRSEPQAVLFGRKRARLNKRRLRRPAVG